MRLSGFGLIGGAVLLGAAIVRLSFKPVMDQLLTPDVSLLLLLASILLLLSLPGMYAQQIEATGWLGLAGHGLLQVGLILITVIGAAPFLYPSIHEVPGESLVAFSLGIALTLGLLLTGLATLRAGVYSRWSGILLLAATAGFFLTFSSPSFFRLLPDNWGAQPLGCYWRWRWPGLAMLTWRARLTEHRRQIRPSLDSPFSCCA